MRHWRNRAPTVGARSCCWTSSRQKTQRSMATRRPSGFSRCRSTKHAADKRHCRAESQPQVPSQVRRSAQRAGLDADHRPDALDGCRGCAADREGVQQHVMWYRLKAKRRGGIIALFLGVFTRGASLIALGTEAIAVESHSYRRRLRRYPVGQQGPTAHGFGATEYRSQSCGPWERSPALSRNANGPRDDRAVQSLPTPVHMPRRLRSSVGMVVVGLLLGSTTLPLLLCAGRCPRERVQAPPPHHCHQSSAPATSLSCCCTRQANPASIPATSAAERLLALVVSIVPALAPTTRHWTHDLEPVSLLAHSRRLFMLNSAFLI